MGSFSIVHWAIVALIAWGIWRVLKGGARIKWPGRYSVEVVGESFYEKSFKKLVKRFKPSDRDEEAWVNAVLRLDDNNPHDSNAVAVLIEGLQVGHLSRDMAVSYRAWLKRAFGKAKSELSVPARLYFGGEDGLFSVSLDLPLHG